jgi:hypothetical protein
MHEPPTSPNQIFISYAREDLEFARRLYRDLRRAGHNPWIDEEDLLPGDDWRLCVRRTIQNATYFLALLSNQSLGKRGFVQKELRLAYDVLDELPRGHIFLIPVRLEPCAPVDDRITALNWVDFFPSYTDGFERLLRGLTITKDKQTLDYSPPTDQCPSCGQRVERNEQFCQTCGEHLGSPNIRAAVAEVPQLEQRYRLALDRARVYGTYERVLEFQEVVRHSLPVLTTTIDFLILVLADERLLYKTYSRHLGLAGPVRTIVEAVLFPGYASDLTFASLAINGRGLREYGPVWITLKERFIAHRATVTESDSYQLVSKNLLSDKRPAGFTATWRERDKLAVAKLAHLIHQDSCTEDFDNLLLQGSDRSSDVMEVQINGPVTAHTFESIVVDSRNFTRAESDLLKIAERLCRKHDVRLEVLASGGAGP